MLEGVTSKSARKRMNEKKKIDEENIFEISSFHIYNII